ncbi:hypothetical protein FQV33_02435 [Buchnera aphidicola (Aphis fabae)]|uniref:Flagellar motor switch protein FliM n=1 Tax=Buchnera aphidicola (Aphis fabae) TaxID=571430 RepID=A0A5J6ZDD1_9GAMM|nr:hypothetical protein [Buchnera aphidicola]QFQ32818.1 hypothetical protein FQV33_02435 [Buchnera aphidicola (Aphis fabae)]
MGKSNPLNIENEVTNREKEIHNILNINEIKILEKINENFIKKIIISFSNFIQNNIKLNFFSIKINSYTDHDKDIKYLFSSEVEILNLNKKSYVFFSDNLLSIFIDLLFGGNGTYTDKINKQRDLTYTEKIISQKILQLIFNAYCESFKKIFSIDIKNFNIKIFDIKKDCCIKENYITNYFSLSLNNVEIFLSIVFPLSIVKKNFQKISFSESNKKSFIKNINVSKNIPIVNLFDIELNLITKLIISSKTKCNSLSVGDILIVESPDKVIVSIEKIPIFLGYYKNFNKKLVVFLKKIINKNLDLNRYKEFFNE